MTKGEQARLLAWRPRILQQAADGGNVARVCRRWGISRKSFYKWKQRRAAYGDAGLCDRPRTPKRSPRATPGDVVSKILYLRQHYHFGPARIAAYLFRFHRLQIAGSSVHRILTRHRMNRLPANQKHQPHGKRWQRYEKPQPGHRLQLDVKFLERIPGTRRRLYQFTAIDDCTRIRVLKIYDGCHRVHRRGCCADCRSGCTSYRPITAPSFSHNSTGISRTWMSGHVYIRPRTPHLNGKVERSHRVDDQEFYQLLDQDGISDDIHLFNEKLREWEDYYNYHRPHRALSGQTPYERLLAKTRAEVSPGS